MFSSAADLSTLGLAILKSSLISPTLTRRWLKPIAFTADMRAALGIPWGLRRIPLSDTNPYRTITSFNKGGAIRYYSVLLTLIPDWDIGFTVLLAGNVTSGFPFADLIGQALIPAFDAVARDEANTLYSGTYSSNDNINSSLVVSTDPTKPGLGVGPWISNGTDMVNMALRLQSGSKSPANTPEVRLYWTGLESVAADGSKRQAFKAVFEDTGFTLPDQPKMFSTNCAAWLSQTGTTYGGLPLDEFVFHLDPAGKVVGIENLGLRTTLSKGS
jgi:hypothetical protein